MAKTKDSNDPEGVSSFIQNLEPDFAALIEGIRQLILSTSNEVAEQIKWNSPSFFYTGEMKPFDPKSYKRDIAVLNIRKGVALLIFPTGASIQDESGILEGQYPDGRRMVTIRSLSELHTKGRALQHVIKKWLSQVDK